MKSYQCQCGNRLYFDNSHCLKCDLDVGFCPSCQNMTALVPQPDGTVRCGRPNCSASLRKCANYRQHGVCNRCLNMPMEPAEPTDGPEVELCNCCRFNHTIPDLSVSGNLEKWSRLEAAKRRLFYELDLLAVPYGDASDGIDPPLAFSFKGDTLSAGNRSHSLSQGGRVFTGHHAGTITINITEADDVERERARVTLGEPQRTLLGHFRHEIGHYYWELLVKNRCEQECISVFGDHNSPSYQDALEKYYQEGPRQDWATNFISAYASMHPWEDFAETWATYLTLVSELDTAFHVGFVGSEVVQAGDLSAMVVESQKLSVALNEMNRSLGLMDAVPKPIVGPVVDKLQFIHQVIRQSENINRCALASDNPPGRDSSTEQYDSEMPTSAPHGASNQVARV